MTDQHFIAIITGKTLVQFRKSTLVIISKKINSVIVISDKY
jgi:hypothetical protein